MIDSIKQKLEKLNPIKPTSLKKAGVFIGILYHDEFIENPEVIFTQRSAKVSTHSGEVSFPGGKWEEGDKDLYETSLRESNEEINLNIHDVTYLGSLNYLISKHKIEVNPYIGLVTKKQNNPLDHRRTALEKNGFYNSYLKKCRNKKFSVN